MENQIFAKHKCGSRGCEECIAGYPTLCKCGGMIHSQYDVKEEKGKFVSVGPFMHCDKCGTKFLKTQPTRRKGRAHHNARHDKSHESSRGYNPRVR